MTTLATVKKYAKDKLIPTLKRYGFTYHKALEFSRCYGDGIYQIISGGVSRSGYLEFDLTCFVAEQEPEYMIDFPYKIAMTNGGQLGVADEDPEPWSVFEANSWRVQKEEKIPSKLEEILTVFEQHGLPWFDSIKTRQDYVDALYPHIKEELEENGRLTAVLNPSK